jgi:hypothetical protein
MDKYAELKTRIEGLKNGWDKEADDILQEIQGIDNCYISIKCNNRKLGEALDFFIEIQDNRRKGISPEWRFTDQCEKLQALKSAFLWLLDDSGIEKDEKQEELTVLEIQLKDIQKQIEELKKWKISTLSRGSCFY